MLQIDDIVARYKEAEYGWLKSTRVLCVNWLISAHFHLLSI